MVSCALSLVAIHGNWLQQRSSSKEAHFVITSDGAELLRNPPPRIDIKVLGRYPAFVAFQARTAKARSVLPVQFDEATKRTIELIDVLWLKGKAIVAAFEVESTTSIYSGLLRMADLVSMQPNINLPLYLVAPEERRDKFII